MVGFREQKWENELGRKRTHIGSRIVLGAWQHCQKDDVKQNRFHTIIDI